MLNFLIILILCLIINPKVSDADYYWIKWLERSDSVTYVDFGNSTLKGSSLNYYSINDFQRDKLTNGFKWKSMIANMSLDCNDMSNTILSLKYFRENMGNGSEMYSYSLTKSEQEQIRKIEMPGSNSYRQLSNFCEIVIKSDIIELQDYWRQLSQK